MPFTTGDVEGHIKGLTPAAKKIWVNVANSVLTKCTEAGGADCEGSAIRQANAVAKKNLTEEQAAAWVEAVLPGGGWFSDVACESEVAKFLAQYKHETTHNAKGVEIFAIGTWNGDTYTVDDLNHMVDAFGKIGFDPPLKLGHNSEQEEKLMKDGQPALGWIDNLFVQGGKLLADFRDMPKAVFEAIKNKRYRTVSSEIWWNFPDNGRKFPRVLKAVALLGADIPAVTTLKPIEFKRYEGDGGEELKVVDYNNGGFDDAETKKREKDMATEQELRDEIADLKTKNNSLEESNKTLGDDKAGLEGKNTKLEGENKELAKSEEATKTELSKRDDDVKTAEVKAFVGKMKAEGRLLPKHEEEVTALLTAASEEKTYKFSDKDGKSEELSQRETLERVFKTMPDMLQFTEVGTADGLDTVEDHSYSNQAEAGTEVDRRTKAHMTKQAGDGKEVTYSDAMQVVLNKDSKLKKAYTGLDE